MVLGQAGQPLVNVFCTSPLQVSQVVGVVDHSHAVSVLVIDLAFQETFMRLTLNVLWMEIQFAHSTHPWQSC
jgi:hypothetical protein